MSNIPLSLEALEKAYQSLAKAVAKPKDEFIRDSVIQRFEYTFELSWKTLKRYFKMYQNLEESNIKDIFREAGKQGLIDSVEKWFHYQDARNLTSHTYREDFAEDVYLAALDFEKDCKLLIDRLNKKI